MSRRKINIMLLSCILFLIMVIDVKAQLIFEVTSINIESFADRGENSIYVEWHDYNSLLPYAPYLWVEGFLTYRGQTQQKISIRNNRPLFLATLCIDIHGEQYKTKVLFSDLIDEPTLYYPTEDPENQCYILYPNVRTNVSFGGVILSEKMFSALAKFPENSHLSQKKRCAKRLSKICNKMKIQQFLFESNIRGIVITDNRVQSINID